MATISLVASGDLRPAANQNCQAAQAEMEAKLGEAAKNLGAKIIRAHLYDPAKKHGFIDSQKYGMEVFRTIPPNAPLIVAEAVWQYSHHVLAGLTAHRGPILTVANWSGTWPGLVGMLNLNASLTKAGVAYSTLWSEDFSDEFFLRGFERWLRKEGRVSSDRKHVQIELEYPSDQEIHEICCVYSVKDHPYFDALLHDTEKRDDNADREDYPVIYSH